MKYAKVFIFTAFLLLLVGLGSAVPATDTTQVTGKIYINGTEVPSASVNVTCDGALAETSSNENGTYFVVYDVNCTNVEISVMKDNYSGNASGNTSVNFPFPGLSLFQDVQLTLNPVVAPTDTTQVTGKIYINGTEVPSASVNVTCDSYLAQTSSNENGTYFVVYDVNCTNVEISVMKDNYSGNASGNTSVNFPFPGLSLFQDVQLTLNPVDNSSNSTTNSTNSTNTTTTTTTTTGGNGGGASSASPEVCEEWSVCIDGNQTQTCQVGTQGTLTRTRECVVELNATNNETQILNQTQEEQGNGTAQNRGFFSITGNAIADAGKAITKPQWGIPLLVLLILIGYFVIRKKRK